MVDQIDRDVVMYFEKNGNIKTYSRFPDYFKNETNRRRKLRQLIRRVNENLPEIIKSTEPSYGLKIDNLLFEKVKLYLLMNSNKIDHKTNRSFLIELLTSHNKLNLLRKNGGKHTFGGIWSARALKRWNIKTSKNRFIETAPEMSNEVYRQMLLDRSSILRRKPDDPLPCRLSRSIVRKCRYEDEDEEGCWENTLLGDKNAVDRLTLDDKLMLPCSIRSLCPELQELFRVSISKEYLLPFPLKAHQNENKIISIIDNQHDTIHVHCAPQIVVSCSSPRHDSRHIDCVALSNGKLLFNCHENEDISAQAEMMTTEEEPEDHEHYELNSVLMQPGSCPNSRAKVPHSMHYRQLFPADSELSEKNTNSSQRLITPQQAPPQQLQRSYRQSVRSRVNCNVSSELKTSAIPWPLSFQSLFLDNNANTLSNHNNLMCKCYENMYDLQQKLPWLEFHSRHQDSIATFNVFAGKGVYGQRVAVHAHHFPTLNYHPAGAKPVEFGENMPSFDRKLTEHFNSAVKCTGLNVSLLVVRKIALSMFDAIASCVYATRPRPFFDLSSTAAKQLRNFPSSPESLFEACLSWLSVEEKKLFACKIDAQIVSAITTSSNNKTILDKLYEAASAGQCDLFRVTSSDRYHGLSSSTAGAENKETIQQKLWAVQKYLGRFKLKDIDGRSALNTQGYSSNLNDVFLRVLCNKYFMKIIVIDHIRRCIITYPYRGTQGQSCQITLFKVANEGDEDYYYGLIDNDKFMCKV
jgi:hypothetical protein